MTTTLTTLRPAAVTAPAAAPFTYPEPYHYRGTFDPYLAGTVVYAYVPFADRRGGKSRPVVIVSVGYDCYYARPLYTNPSRYAGSWRATPITLEGTDLDHAGYLAPGIVRIEKSLKGRKGRLSFDDWNYLRTGNGNWGYES